MLSPLLLIEIFKNISFVKYAEIFLCVNSEIQALFLQAHQTFDSRIGEEVGINEVISEDLETSFASLEIQLNPKKRKFEDIDNSSYWYIAESLFDGRCFRIHNGKTEMIRDGKDICFSSKVKQTTLTEEKYIVTFENSQFKLLALKYGIPNHYSPVGFIAENNKFYSVHECGYSFDKVEFAQKWLERIKQLKPGDKLSFNSELIKSKKHKKENKRTGNQNIVIDYVITDKENLESIPSWLISPFQKEQLQTFSYKSKDSGDFTSLKGLLQINESPFTSFYSEGNFFVTSGMYVVRIGPGFPIFKVDLTYENGYIARPFGTNHRLFFKKEKPLVHVFKTKNEATVFQTEKIKEFDSKLKKLNPGDAIFISQKNNNANFEWVQIKNIIQVDPTISEPALNSKEKITSLEESSSSESEDEFLISKEMIGLSPSEPLWITPKKKKTVFKIPPLHNFKFCLADNSKREITANNVYDCILFEEKESEEIWNEMKSLKITVKKGDEIDIKFGKKTFRWQKVERIINKGVVLCGMFYLTDKIVCTRKYEKVVHK